MRLERRGSVIRHLEIKRRYLQSAHPVGHEETRPLLVAGSGVFRGVPGAACLTALWKAGHRNTFDKAIAISTGAPMVGFFLGDDPEVGETIYWQECLSGKFIPMNLLDGAKAVLSQLGVKHFAGHHLMDIEYLCRVFRGQEGNKPMNIKALKDSRTGFQVQVVRCSDGEGVLLDIKKLADPIEGIRAAIAIPGVSNGKVAIDGVEYEDGVGVSPCDIEQMVREHNPTDILLLANRPKGDHSHLVEQLLTKWATNDECDKLREDFATREVRFQKGIDFLYDWPGRWNIIWNEDDVSTIEIDAQKLQKAAKDAEAWMTQLIKEETR